MFASSLRQNQIVGPVLTSRHCWTLALVMPVVLAPVLSGPQDWTSTPVTTVTGLVLSLLLVTATVTDLANRKIYNWTTYTAFVWAILINTPINQIAFAANTEAQLAAIGLRQALTGGVVCFALMLVAYALARGGAGDVKLAAAIGALVGVDDGVLIVAFSYILAAVAILVWTILTDGPLALVISLARKFGAYVVPWMVTEPSEDQRALLEKPIPLAGFFAVGTMCVLFDVTSFVRNWL